MARQAPKRKRISSAHLIALVALFVALGAGAYAAGGKNTVGAKQIKKGAVRASEIRDGTITAVELASGAITTSAIQDGAITSAKLAQGAVTSTKVGSNAITTDAIQDGAITAAKVADDAKATLFTDVNAGPTNVSTATGTVVGTLTLPAGSYLVTAGASAVHNGTAASTRLECSVGTADTVVDASKERLAANNAGDALIFTKQEFGGPLTLTSAGTVNYTCASTNNTSIDLTSVRLMALRVTNIVAQ